ncbi:MAG: MoxR family ATPase [Candidatus Bathyarchaeota archaeon]|nr:MAG: MoxR family ATPase [Candidatus Bathyarchaeota archaeon]
MNLEKARTACKTILRQVLNLYVGDELLVMKLLAATLANGHVLFEDNPGLGKTLLAKTLAFSVDCDFSRVQCTPDLLPADILGTKVWRPKDGSFELFKGPVFTNVLLVDEINRSPPKTQSAVLEVMEERQVTIEGATYRCEEPFFVLATQNPIEYEGTYPLPEAQIDRFMMKLSTGYPRTLDEEKLIVKRRIAWKKDDPTRDLKPVISAKDFSSLQKAVENDIYIDEVIIRYIAEIVRETRKHPQVEVGSSPRGSLALLKASRAMALIGGRDFVTPDDIKMLAVDALAHRLILKVEDVMKRVDERKIVQEALDSVVVPKDYNPR